MPLLLFNTPPLGWMPLMEGIGIGMGIGMGTEEEAEAEAGTWIRTGLD